MSTYDDVKDEDEVLELGHLRKSPKVIEQQHNLKDSSTVIPGLKRFSERITALERCITRLSDDSKEHQSSSDELRKTCEGLRCEKDRLIQENRALVDSKIALRAQRENVSVALELLRKENNSQAETLGDFRQGICDFSDKLMDKGQEYEKVCDSDIVGDWQNLTYLIGQAVANCLSLPPQRDNSVSEDQQHLGKLWVSIQKRKLLGEGVQLFVIQAYIWVRLDKEVFAGSQSIWAGAAGVEFSKFSRFLETQGYLNASAAEVYSKIKSENAHQLDKHFGVDKDGTRICIDGITQDLKFLLSEDVEEETLRRKIDKIVHEANSLRVTLLKSKSLFKIEWPLLKGIKGPSIPDDEVDVCYQELSTSHNEREVVRVVSPALHKCGFADGHGFECQNRLVNARIIVALPHGEGKVRQHGRGPASSRTEARRSTTRAQHAVEDTDSQCSAPSEASDSDHRDDEDYSPNN